MTKCSALLGKREPEYALRLPATVHVRNSQDQELGEPEKVIRFGKQKLFSGTRILQAFSLQPHVTAVI